MLQEQELSFGPYRLQLLNEQLWRGKRAIRLTPKAFAVLRYLSEHPGQLVTKDALFEAVWHETVVSEATLAGCIRDVRKALDDDAQTPRFIETVHRRGYRFIARVNDLEPETPNLQSEQLPSVQPLNGNEVALETGRSSPQKSLEPATETTPITNGEQFAPPAPPAEEKLASRSWLHAARLTGVVLFIVGGLVVMVRLLWPVQDKETMFPLPSVDKPSIAILPFVNMSGDPQQEYFSDGMTDTLITDLSKVSGLFVIARNSVFFYKGKAVKIAQVGQELGVRYVLQGSVQKADTRVRINTQLIDAATGGHVWAERYDRELQDLFSLQDEITQKIVLALKVSITPEEQIRFRQAPTNNLEAYEYYWRAFDNIVQMTKPANDQARQLLQKAIELDSQYAGAYALLGHTYFHDWLQRWTPDKQDLDRAIELAQQAVALDDTLAEAHLGLGNKVLFRGQFDQAFAELERAISLDPNYGMAYAWLSLILSYAGRPAEAIEVVKKAIQLDPHFMANYFFLGVAYSLSGQYEEALVALKKCVVRTPGWQDPHFFLAFVYSELGREAEAQAEVAEIRRLNPAISLKDKRVVPFKDSAASERYYAALRKAGLE